MYGLGCYNSGSCPIDGEVDKILYILTGTWYNYTAFVKVWCGVMACTGRMADEIFEI